jgi:uncharacterized protein HemY
MTGSMKADEAAALSAEDEGYLIEELRSLKSRWSPRRSCVAQAVQILEQTGSLRVRNAAALALADLRASDAKDLLIALVRRPDTKGSRGTLLYTLGELAANVPLSVLTDVVAADAYEAREEALDFIRRGRVVYSAEEYSNARKSLEVALAAADQERSEAIGRALEYLRVRHS